MQQPYVRVGAHHRLPVEREDEAQHAVSRRVLRPEVQDQVLHLLLPDDRAICGGGGERVNVEEDSVCVCVCVRERERESVCV